MQVNGVGRHIDEEGTTPVVIKGKTMVPIRPVIEAMGGTVEWNGAEQKTDRKKPG